MALISQRGFSLLKMLFGFGFLITTTFAHFTDLPFQIPGLKIPKNPHVRVLEIDNFYDFLWATLYVGLFYFAIFLGFGGVLEYTNPIPKNEFRWQTTKKQLLMGLQALLFVILSTTLWLWFGDKHMPYFGFQAQNDFTLYRFVMNLIVYMFVFDTWFYWTHIVLHYPKLWDWIHKYHHQFIEPTAFAQDAVHPIEAIVQGPMGHFITTLVYPMHPVAISAFGFLTSLYALFAHDGRSMDWNNHTMHHYYKSCNYGLYWGFWDYVCGTRYNKQKFPYDYVPSWLTEKSGTAAVKPRTRQAN